MKLARLFVCTLAIVLLSAPAMAQGGGRGGRAGGFQAPPQLSPEKQKAAWQWQAKEVAADIKLKKEQTAKLVKVYQTAREELAKAIEKAREEARNEEGEGGGRGGRGGFGFGANSELNEKHAKSLKTAIGEFLDETQTRKAISSLGTFSGQWDRQTDAILGLKLSDEKKLAALAPIRKYVVGLDKIMNSGDRSGMREAFMDARDKLEKGLKEVLSEEQYEKYQEKAGGGFGRGRGGRGGGGI